MSVAFNPTSVMEGASRDHQSKLCPLLPDFVQHLVKIGVSGGVLLKKNHQLNLHLSARLNLRPSFIKQIPSVVYNHNASGFIVLHPFGSEKT